MREYRTPGSVRGAPGNRRSYRDMRQGEVAEEIMSRLNPPERILRSIASVSGRMSAVDEALGISRRQRFAELISDFLVHTEPSTQHVYDLLPKPKGALVCMYLISSATEFETAWNVIRLANVQASFRQSRVAGELAAFGVLLAIPRTALETLSKNLDFVQCLKKNPGCDINDLWRPAIKVQGRKTIKKSPRLRGSAIYPAFLAAARDLLGLPQSVVENLREYQKSVQHPAAHSSVEVCYSHYENFENYTEQSKAGAFFAPDRTQTYQDAADDLINLVDWMENLMRLTEQYLADNGKYFHPQCP